MDTEGVHKSRQRLRMACDPCRERKRKCDGARPCHHCRGYGFDCFYRSTPRRRRPRRAPDVAEPGIITGESSPSATAGASSWQHERRQQYEQQQQQQQQHQHQQQQNQPPETSPGGSRPVESNSGAAFARLLTMTLDPSNQGSPPLRMLAWNLYLGERRVAATVRPARLNGILSEAEMQRLAAIYLDKVHPCYGFVDRDMLHKSIAYAWRGPSLASAQHALLCGVAALAYLFSGAQELAVELSLVELTKGLLDPATADPPDAYSATAWLLRTVYLRLTAKPEEAWLASCTTLHIIDAAGLNGDLGRSNAFSAARNLQALHIGQRIFGVAQHLNMWMSYDLGRCRVILQNFGDAPLSVQPGEYTTELLDLLPYSEDLDPEHGATVESLTAALAEVLDRTHSQPPSVLAQCNLMLCIHRRLHASRSTLTEEVMNGVLNLIKRSIQAVRSSIATALPWHHVANIPFQVVCTLLVIDTAPSFALLADSLGCLEAVNDAYQTAATREAVTAAYTLLQLHQKRREDEVKKQSEMLSLYPAVHSSSAVGSGDLLSESTLLDSWWFNEFVADLDPNTI